MIRLSVKSQLKMKTPTRPGRPSYVTAASGLLRAGDAAYVVADDEAAVAVYDAGFSSEGEWMELLPGSLPLEREERKRAKPDLELIFRLPATLFPPHGAVCLLPSGSLPNRMRGFLLGIEKSGKLTGVRRDLDATKLYAAFLLELHKAGFGSDAPKTGGDAPKALSRLNVEGACLSGSDLWVFNRGNDTPAINAVFICAAAPALRLLAGPSLEVEQVVRRVVFPELGDLDGMPLSFTDACALDDGRILYCAAAEDTCDAVADGEVVGSVLGLLDREGRVVAQERVEGRWKIEGIEGQVVENGAIEIRAVHDADRDETPSELLLGLWEPR